MSHVRNTSFKYSLWATFKKRFLSTISTIWCGVNDKWMYLDSFKCTLTGQDRFIYNETNLALNCCTLALFRVLGSVCHKDEGVVRKAFKFQSTTLTEYYDSEIRYLDSSKKGFQLTLSIPPHLIIFLVVRSSLFQMILVTLFGETWCLIRLEWYISSKISPTTDLNEVGNTRGFP